MYQHDSVLRKVASNASMPDQPTDGDWDEYKLIVSNWDYGWLYAATEWVLMIKQPLVKQPHFSKRKH